jgi:hypothetical protein
VKERFAHDDHARYMAVRAACLGNVINWDTRWGAARRTRAQRSNDSARFHVLQPKRTLRSTVYVHM